MEPEQGTGPDPCGRYTRGKARDGENTVQVLSGLPQQIQDSHEVCNLCLDDDHEEKSCPACAEFVPKALRTRKRQRAAHRAMKEEGTTSKLAEMGFDSREEDAEAEMGDEEIELSENESDDIEAQKAEAARKAAREEERRRLKVKTLKIPLPKSS